MRKFSLSLPYTNAALVPKIHLWTIDNEPIKLRKVVAVSCQQEKLYFLSTSTFSGSTSALTAFTSQ
jgi:hypothetical protein